MAVIVYKNANNHLVETGTSVMPDPEGWDVVTTRMYFGSGGGKAAFPVGSVKVKPVDFTVGAGMICFGLSDVRELAGGAEIATITWRGVLDIDGRSKRVTETRSVRERLITSITGIPGTSGAKVGRIFDLLGGWSERYVTFTKEAAPDMGTAAPTGAPASIKQFPTVVGGAVVYNYPNGWICTSWEREEPLPGIYFIKGEYRFEHPTTSG